MKQTLEGESPTLTKHANVFLQMFVGAYRELCSSRYILINLIEEWKMQLDQSKITDAIALNLSKVSYCISHDLLNAKLDAYGFEKVALSLIYSNLKNRKQPTHAYNVYNTLLELISGVP